MIAFLMLYVRPITAVGRLIDHGKLWFAVGAAFGVSLLLHYSDVAQRGASSPVLQFISAAPRVYLAPLLAVALVFVPAILLIRAVSGYGSFSVLLNSEFAPLLVCVMASWAAA